jgi:hypothetical protein
VFHPTEASWAHSIESHVGPLRGFVLGNSDPVNHPVLARDLQAYLRWRFQHRRGAAVLEPPAQGTCPHPQRTPATLVPTSAASSLIKTRERFWWSAHERETQP